jgi:DNA-binding Xre family transcriptional regulator
MPMIWNPKKIMVLRKRIYRPTELKIALAECAGVQLSLTSVSALINKAPDVLRVRTMQAICNALNCKLSEFCEIEPDDLPQGNPKPSEATPQQLSGESSDDNMFPDPFQFKTAEDDE